MDDLKSILDRVLKQRGLYGHAQAALVVHRARTWIAAHLPELHDAVTVERFIDGIVIIHCRHSTGLQTCREILPDLLKALQKDCGTEVRDVRLERNRAHSESHSGAGESLAEPSTLP